MNIILRFFVKVRCRSVFFFFMCIYSEEDNEKKQNIKLSRAQEPAGRGGAS